MWVVVRWLSEPIAGLALGAAALVSACNGETASGGEVGATSGDVTALCEGQCSLRERCRGDTATTCTSACEAEHATAAPHFRGDMLRELGSCYAGLECDTSDDICSSEAAEAVGVDLKQAADDADVKACLTKQDECRGTPHSFIDDECASLVFMIPASRPRAAACYYRPCAEVRDCIAPYDF